MKAGQKNIFLIALSTLLLVGWLSSASAQQQRASISKVVIDPGHGGKDPGTVYKTLLEKDINLAVAQRLGDLITKYYPDVKIVYTRKTDIFVPLDERGNIANKAGADLFISIHTNATKGAAPSGTETYVLGIDKSGGNLGVAMRENDVIVYESDYTTKYQGYEPGSAESLIIFSLMQYSYLEQSLVFADLVQQHYPKHVASPSRGVKQAGFLVLWRTSMPSVLTELGYINNEKDAAILASDKGRDAYARALFNAFSAYKTKVEGRSVLLTVNDKGEEVRDKQDVAEPVRQEPPKSEPAKTDIIKPDPAKTTVGSQTVTPPATAAKTDEVWFPESTYQSLKSDASGKPQQDYYFSVQVSASRTKALPSNPVFRGYEKELFEVREGDVYRYYIGKYLTYAQALRAQSQIRTRIKDAFIVAFRDGRLANIDLTDGGEPVVMARPAPVQQQIQTATAQSSEQPASGQPASSQERTWISSPSSSVSAQSSAREEQKPAPAPAKVFPPKDYFFSVQVSASPSRSSLSDPLFAGYRDRVMEYKENDMYRYYIGRCDTYAEAARLQAELRRRVNGAFIVALRDGKKIPITNQMK